MDRKILTERINQKLETINEQTEIINSHKNKIPQIELDIILSNIRELYEEYCQLNKLNSKLNTIVKDSCEVDKIKESTVSTEMVNEETAEITNKKEKTTKETKSSEKSAEDSDFEKEEILKTSQDKELTEEESKSSTESSVDLFSDSETTTVSDKYGDESKSINEDIAENKTGESIAEKMRHNSIEDLKTTIGINEKFLFINELFDGNMQEYDEVIDKLNNFKTYEEAIEHINLLKPKYKWDEDLTSLNKLNELIQRRYS